MRDSFFPNTFSTIYMSEIQKRKTVIMQDGKKYDNLIAEFNTIRNRVAEDSKTSCNNSKRKLYADCELLILKIGKYLKEVSREDDECVNLKRVVEELSNFSSNIPLEFVQRNNLWGVFSKVEEIFRLVTVWLFIIISSVVIALPAIFVTHLDYFLVRMNVIKPHYQLSMLCKRFIAYGCIKLYGIEMITENYNPEIFGKDCCIVCYSHASTLDAFLFSTAIPVRHYSLAKSDLFLIPFFSWSLVSFGGVPIDRSNREQAIRAIQAAISSAQAGDCLAIAPEGTRSLSGQILPFKKGTFYMWEQLKTPIIPLVIYGAYDLFPTNRNVPVSGKVYVRYLSPIQASEAATRDEMSHLVRSRMLEAWRNSPADVGSPMSVRAKLEHIFVTVVFYICIWASVVYVPWTAVLHHYSITTFQALSGFVGFCIAITLGFYVYLMYISNWLGSIIQSINNTKEK